MTKTENSMAIAAVPPQMPITCGLIMPISAIDGCSAEHWSDVKQILQDSVESVEVPKFLLKLVSDADDVGVIQKRIVQGVYQCDIVVCDVSGKNPNVMFELGMRLAFDRPTVLVKDDKTEYSFDTSIIEHITYPRDLRFARVVAFKHTLSEKLAATYKASQADPEYSTFLKNFGTFKVAHLNQKDAPTDQVILETLNDMQREMALIRRTMPRRNFSIGSTKPEEQQALSWLLSRVSVYKSENPNFNFEQSEELRSWLVRQPEARLLYPTRKEFETALTDACMLGKSMWHG